MFQDSRTIKIVILDDNIEGDIKDFQSRLERELPSAKNSVRHFEYAHEWISGTYDNDTDIVLLDVEGMPPVEDVIFDIHAKWLRLPIVILSKHDQLRPALDYFRAGAKGYLIKGELPPYTDDETRNVKKAWKDAANLIERLVKEYRAVKYLLYNDRTTGTLIKTRGPKTDPAKFLAQLHFLEIIKGLEGSKITHLFPVECMQQITTDSYKTPFYRAKSLRETLFELKGEEEIFETAQAVIRKVMADLKSDLFDKTTMPPTPGNKPKWFRTFYIEKLEARKAETIEQLSNCNAADQSALLALLQADRLLIGVKRYISPARLLDIIYSDENSIEQLVPERIGLIHGDLHFSNILVDTTVLEKPFVKLIDPGAFLEGADFAYDVGKLLLSSEAKHDMIDEEFLGSEKLVRSVKPAGSVVSIDAPEREYERERELTQGRSGDYVKSVRQEISDAHFRAYDRIAEWLKSELLADLIGDDPTLVIRSRLNAALHSCTVGKFHLERDPIEKGPSKVVAFYVIGVRLMNQLARDLGIDIKAQWDEMDAAKS